MRLICPNCSAQYEVEEDVIPENGRDVQCSNCGNTWYQKSAKQLAERVKSRPVTTPIKEEAPSADEVEAIDETPSASEPTQQSLDPDVTDVLREEAARELAERQAEVKEATAPVAHDTREQETPPHIQERLAKLQDMGDELGEPALEAAPAPTNRKELLPDIEEINSTLAPNEDGTIGEATAISAQAARRGGFRRGFALVIIIFAVMTLVYIYAPKIVSWNTATEPYLASYVDWVNGIRVGADSLMANSAERLSTLLDSLNSGS